jgi:hypothetical protein
MTSRPANRSSRTLVPLCRVREVPVAHRRHLASTSPPHPIYPPDTRNASEKYPPGANSPGQTDPGPTLGPSGQLGRRGRLVRR